TFLLWLLSELFTTLPEVGDPAKPTLVFFFDEAHLLFDDAPKALLDKIEQVVRLIRSKGCGVYFITQNPIDVPDTVAGQLGNRVQHALRAFTPRDQAAVKAAATTFRSNPNVDVATVITQLKVGEALVSTLGDDGAPSPVERTMIAPPRSRVGPITTAERKVMIDTSAVAGKYETPVDRESAYEILNAKSAAAQAAADASAAQTAQEKASAIAAKAQAKADADLARANAVQARVAARPQPKSLGEKMLESAARSAATSLSRQIVGKLGGQLLRGVLGSLFK
ncbi:MAG: helicase HerA-like domain-containing protein, partial [Janthinobacterium lividum]